MPAPASYTYSDQAKIDAQQAFLDLIDAGTAGSIKLRDNSDVLLAQIPLTVPAGTINASGLLTMTASGPDTSADASGECTYGEICDSAGTVHLSMPTEQGVAPVSGKLVISVTAIVQTAEVSLTSCTIG